MAQQPPERPRRNVPPATGEYDPAFYPPGGEEREIFRHYKGVEEDPDDVNAHSALAEVDNPELRECSRLADTLLTHPMVAATAGGTGGDEEDNRTEDQKFFDVPEDPEKINEAPASAELPTLSELRQRAKRMRGEHPERGEFHIDEATRRLKHRFIAALGSIGLGDPHLAY